MTLSKPKQFYYLLAFISVGILLGSATFLQLYRGVNPCPLCILQRLVMGALGLLFLFGVAARLGTFSKWSIGILSILFSLLGIGIAGRQVWLQHLPQTPGANCEVSLQYLLNALPFFQVMEKIFQGGTNCSEVGWSFILSLAQWSLVCFIVYLLFSIWQLRRD